MLRLVAQDGDYERLDLILVEFREHLPVSDDEEILGTAQRALQSLVDKKLALVYRRQRLAGATYSPIPMADSRLVIGSRRYWYWNEDGAEDIGAAPTPEGQRMYELKPKIPSEPA